MAVLGSEPEIYFLSRRHSVTGYIYTYGMMEPQPFARRMQEEMIHDIETTQPGFIIFVDAPMSWFRQPDSDLRIFDWWNSYQTNYTLVAISDVISPTETINAWGADVVKRYGGVRGTALEVYQRSDQFARPPVKSRRGGIILTIMTASFTNPILRKACWIMALSLTGASVLLHFFSLTQAGGLWRDEIAIANIATLPSWAETFRALPHDHCPIVFPAVVRIWTALGLAQTDTGLRVLGLGIGLFLLASFWAASRMMGKGLPLLSLAIVAVNPVVIRYGDSIRGYALGIAFIVLTMGLIWRFIEAPEVGRGLLAGVLAVVSVQTLYQNAFFLLAIGIGGVVVSLRQRQPAKALGVLGIGAVAALSLLPYVNPIRQAQSWWVVSQTGTNLEITLDRLSKLNGPFFGVWVAVVVLAVVFGIGRAILVPRRDPVSAEDDLPLFGSIALVLGAVGFGVFIQLTGLLTQTWYYLPALCFTMVCCDAIVSRMHPTARLACWYWRWRCLSFRFRRRRMRHCAGGRPMVTWWLRRWPGTLAPTI